MALTLLIDTSTERGFVALSEGTRIVFHEPLPLGRHHSSALPKVLMRAMREEPGAVAVATGPGLFTGIRVGVAAAKGIAYGLGIPLVGFCSLSGFVLEEERFVSMIDARSRGAYILEHPGGSPQLVPLEEVPDLPLVGPSFARLALAHATERDPDPACIARLVKEKLTAGEFTTDGSVEILYLKEPMTQTATLAIGG